MDRSVTAMAIAALSLLLAAGLATGCAAGSGHPSSAGESPAATGGSAAGAGPASTKTASSRPSTAVAASSSAPATGAAGAVPSTGASTASTHSAAAVGLTPAGSYAYRVRGSASSALGSQDVSGNGTLTVDPPTGDRQHSQQRDRAGTTDQTVLARAGGLFLDDLRMARDGFNEEFRPAAPVLLFPAAAQPGRRWHWQMTSTDGKYTLAATLRVGRPQVVTTADGHTVRTVTVESVLTVTGDSISMTINQLDHAARDGLIVTEHAVADGTAYGTKFHSDTTRTLVSAPR